MLGPQRIIFDDVIRMLVSRTSGCCDNGDRKLFPNQSQRQCVLRHRCCHGNNVSSQHVLLVVVASISLSSASIVAAIDGGNETKAGQSVALRLDKLVELRSSSDAGFVTAAFDDDAYADDEVPYLLTSNCSTSDNATICGNLTSTLDGNFSSSAVIMSGSERRKNRGWLMTEMKMIKAIVLVVVISLLLLSTCTFLFRTSSLFAKSKDDDPS